MSGNAGSIFNFARSVICIGRREQGCTCTLYIITHGNTSFHLHEEACQTLKLENGFHDDRVHCLVSCLANEQDSHEAHMQVFDFVVAQMLIGLLIQLCGMLQTAGHAGSATVELVANDFVQAIQLDSDAGKALCDVARVFLLSTSTYLLFLLLEITCVTETCFLRYKLTWTPEGCVHMSMILC